MVCTQESGIWVYYRCEKNHFCFYRACTAKEKKLLLNLLVLVLMDLNRQLHGTGGGLICHGQDGMSDDR